MVGDVPLKKHKNPKHKQTYRLVLENGSYTQGNANILTQNALEYVYTAAASYRTSIFHLFVRWTIYGVVRKKTCFRCIEQERVASKKGARLTPSCPFWNLYLIDVGTSRQAWVEQGIIN